MTPEARRSQAPGPGTPKLGSAALTALLLWGCGGDSGGPGPGTAGSAAVPEPDPVKPPNILLVSLDTLRADRLGTYGHDRDTSPFLDRIAAEGARFDDLSAPSSKTATSHMSMFSGMHPGVHGVRNSYEPEAQAASGDLPLLPEVLAEAGYRTAAFTGGGMMAGELGFARGFQHQDERGGGADRVFDRAETWLRDWAATEGQGDDPRPLFLFVHTYEIHDPYTAPPAWQERFVDPAYAGKIDSTRVELPEDAAEMWKQDPTFYIEVQRRFWDGLQATPEDMDHLSDLYDAGIAYTDHLLEGLWGAVQELGLSEDILLVITSDHGESLGQHGHLTHESLHQEVLHVPLLVRWPGRVDAGRTIPEPVQGVDLYPSLLDLAGLEPPVPVQGRSWAPRLDADPAVPGEVDLVWAELGTPGNEELALRWGRYKLIGDRPTRTAELFDLVVDPGETIDGSDNFAEMARHLSRLAVELEEANAELAPAYRTVGVTLGAAAQGQLDALGYTGDE